MLISCEERFFSLKQKQRKIPYSNWIKIQVEGETF